MFTPRVDTSFTSANMIASNSAVINRSAATGRFSGPVGVEGGVARH
jgi:hypothetical protein